MTSSIPTPTFDAGDLRTLLTAIVSQAVDDYTKLQPPTSRIKKYMQEHYLEAVDFIQDPEYRFEFVPNDDGEPSSVREILGAIFDTEHPPLTTMIEYAIAETHRYWENRKMAVLDHIPDTVCISGHTFQVQHKYITSYEVDLDTHVIHLDKITSKTNANELNFMHAVVEAILLIADVPVKKSLVRLLMKELFWVLKVNNFFSYVGVASDSQLFAKKTTTSKTSLLAEMDESSDSETV